MQATTKFITLCSSAALIVGSAALSSAQDQVAAKSEAVKVKVVKGGKTVERTYVLRYTAFISINHYEDGHPAIPLEGKFTDTRQCHWTLKTWVVRKVCAIDPLLEKEVCIDELTKPFETNFTGKGSDFVVTRLRSENCGDAEARFQSDVNDSRTNVNNALPNVVLADRAQWIDDFKRQVNAEKVEIVP